MHGLMKQQEISALRRIASRSMRLRLTMRHPAVLRLVAALYPVVVLQQAAERYPVVVPQQAVERL